MTKQIQFLNRTPLADNNESEWKKRNTYQREVRQKENFQTIWSMYDVTDFDALALDGEHKVYFLGRFNPVEDKSEARKITLLNPTWLDLWRAADELICESEKEFRTDLYIEGFEPDSDGYLEVSYGS